MANWPFIYFDFKSVQLLRICRTILLSLAIVQALDIERFENWIIHITSMLSPTPSFLSLFFCNYLTSWSPITLPTTDFTTCLKPPSSLSLLSQIFYYGFVATTAIMDRFNNFYLHGSSMFINYFHYYSDITLSLSPKGLTTSTCTAQQTSTSPTSDLSSTTMCATWERSASLNSDTSTTTTTTSFPCEVTTSI